jgi:hypothetical protein
MPLRLRIGLTATLAESQSRPPRRAHSSFEGRRPSLAQAFEEQIWAVAEGASGVCSNQPRNSRSSIMAAFGFVRGVRRRVEADEHAHNQGNRQASVTLSFAHLDVRVHGSEACETLDMKHSLSVRNPLLYLVKIGPRLMRLDRLC